MLLAAVSDAAHPTWRTTALGIYLSWRDVGVIGALVGGVTAVLTTLDTATLLATLTAVSGLLTRSAATAMKASVPGSLQHAGRLIPTRSVHAGAGSNHTHRATM